MLATVVLQKPVKFLSLLSLVAAARPIGIRGHAESLCYIKSSLDPREQRKIKCHVDALVASWSNCFRAGELHGSAGCRPSGPKICGPKSSRTSRVESRTVYA